MSFLGALAKVENSAIKLGLLACVAFDGLFPENFCNEAAMARRGFPVARKEVEAEMCGLLADVLLAVFWQNHKFGDAMATVEVLGMSVDHGEAKELVRALLANEEGEALWLGKITVKPLVFKDGIVGHFVAISGAFFEKGILQEAIKGVFFVWGDFV